MDEMMQEMLKAYLNGILQSISTFWYLVVLIILLGIYRLFKPKIKGFVGEKGVSALLRLLDKNKYMILNDILLHNENKSAQIDHIIISNYGIFVIETKNYKGWIIGKEQDTYWKQVIYKNQNKFYNPIKQNIGHVKAIKNILIDYPDLPIIPIVVFSNDAELKIDTNAIVIYTVNLLKTIKSSKEECINDNLKKIVCDKLEKSNLTDRSVRKQHVTQIKELKNEQRQDELCPRCKSKLKLREGKYGKFLGCSNFPKCRYTVKK